MSEIDWTKRPEWIEEIRQTELKQMQSLKSIFMNDNHEIVDLGCGHDRYLQKIFEFKNYFGIDICCGDLKIDVRNIDKKILKSKFVVSLGLFCFLTDDEKTELIDKIDEGIIQLNRNDTELGRKIEKHDREHGVKNFYIKFDDIEKLFMKTHKICTHINEASFVIYMKIRKE